MQENRNEPVISFVITVFNKAGSLPAMIHSVLRCLELSNLNCEYIFVDDASTDDSIRTVEKNFRDHGKSENLIIILNQQNRGPAIRLNQGCRAALGRYLFLMDADDVLAQNALTIMLDSIQTERADFVFGGYEIMNKEQRELLSIELPVNPDRPYELAENPLDTVLQGRYVRMAYLTTRELYLKAGGADERIFIQDESLPLRLAASAKKMITLNHPAVYASRNERFLSDNKLQQMHDRFYAYYYALLEFKNLSSKQKFMLYRRAISSVWKAKRASKALAHKLFFINYLKSRLPFSNVDMENLNQYKNFMDNFENVRKIF